MVKKRNENYFKLKSKNLEDPGIDPGTSRMLSGRSTIWANPPFYKESSLIYNVCL